MRFEMARLTSFKYILTSSPMLPSLLACKGFFYLPAKQAEAVNLVECYAGAVQLSGLQGDEDLDFKQIISDISWRNNF